MATYKELLQQEQDLEAKIIVAKKREFAAAVIEIKQLIVDYGVTAVDLGLGSKTKGAKATRLAVTAKYRDPLSGSTWSGRGRPPAWTVGKKLTDFLI